MRGTWTNHITYIEDRQGRSYLSVLEETKKDLKLLLSAIQNYSSSTSDGKKDRLVFIICILFFTTNKVNQWHSKGVLLDRVRDVLLRDHKGRPANPTCPPLTQSLVRIYTNCRLSTSLPLGRVSLTVTREYLIYVMCIYFLSYLDQTIKNAQKGHIHLILIWVVLICKKGQLIFRVFHFLAIFMKILW